MLGKQRQKYTVLQDLYEIALCLNAMASNDFIKSKHRPADLPIETVLASGAPELPDAVGRNHEGQGDEERGVNLRAGARRQKVAVPHRRGDDHREVEAVPDAPSLEAHIPAPLCFPI